MNGLFFYYFSRQLNKVKEILHYANKQNYIEINQIDG